MAHELVQLLELLDGEHLLVLVASHGLAAPEATILAESMLLVFGSRCILDRIQLGKAVRLVGTAATHLGSAAPS